jgi:LysR family transcriptional regulator, glycine cleavage system transcriptional activator
MRKGMRQRPSLNALRTFEVAGRRQSFSAAAQELNVSQAAVSRQIRKLEQQLGRRLFVRVYRGVVLTVLGHALLRRLTQAFSEIEDAVSSASQERLRMLRVSADPAFATCWLAPRLDRFLEECTDIDLHIDSSAGLSNVGVESDLAVRYLSQRRRKCSKNMEHLIDVIGFPVASPSLLQKRGPVTTPDQLSQLPLLHEDDGGCWRRWLTAAGVRDVTFRHQIQMDDQSALLRAAVDGQGVVIANAVVASDDLAAGRLVKLSPIEVLYGGYWLVHAPEGRRSSAERRFGRWLRENLTAFRPAQGMNVSVMLPAASPVCQFRNP